MLCEEALLDAQKVIELDPSSYRGYQLKYTALHSAQRYDEAIDAFRIMLFNMDNTFDPQIRKLRQQYLSPSEAERTILKAIHARLENAPFRLLDTTTGLLCDREAQISAFTTSTKYEELLLSTMKHENLRMEHIEEVVMMYFHWVMLSHRWEGEEPLLHDIQEKVVYELDPVDGVVKLQSFCKAAHDMGYRWAWSDTCCIDKNNNVDLQKTINFMFLWYRSSALTIVYLSDVPPSLKSGALAKSAWITRGWTIGEFLAPKVVLFYQNDWTPYLDDRSSNHKESLVIMQEMADATGMDGPALVAFRPGVGGAREALRWASMRVTTLQEDIAYSLFGIFDVHIPVIYGEKKQKALGRLLEEIVAQSGEITALDWVGKSSEFNSCLPANITSYKAPPFTPPSLSEDEIQTLVSSLRSPLTVELASQLYTQLNNIRCPRFAHGRLLLPCIAFVVTEIRLMHTQDQETYFTYEVKADGLRDLLITTEDRHIRFSPARPTKQTFLIARPWDRRDLDLPDFVDDTQSVEDRSDHGSLGQNDTLDWESHLLPLREVVRLGQPFSAFLLAQQRSRQYKRIASDHNIIAQVKNMASVRDMMDVRTLEIL
ncbi:hypothetical protein K503DRAFT_331321 [Rhizopogon vinicolor AM-OR11-026]|uniref:Heterokaryon incompatibility domain-containing protein n=1 Tax=Rhizopogon vinicolor AM-OR11-026 TaxID=1314800 RepID=A0A1B7MTT7_9AGAM|nr:hypothetical protein K503DRAFT_331321 [Rhizopogon vinicolor AM-OR11-026]